MSTFMEVSFHRVGESAHSSAVAALDAVPGVEILLDHTRERGWLQRQRLLVEEWDCRIVLWIHEHTEREDIHSRESTELDPYRFLDFGGPVKKVPSEVARMIEELEADYALVDAGWLRFETRSYEAELLDSLGAELEGIAQTYAKVSFGSDRGVLRGRVEGQIPVVRNIQRCLLRSGMVDPARILVGYV
jgi:hypothetical protein